jgi:type I thyroxine 5'-deiodinase
VYIREAHPSDGWQMPINEKEGVVHKEPKTATERADLAKDCREALKLSLPMLLDGMDNAVNRAYSAWPDRLYLIGKDGRIAYKGRPGPGGFNPRELAQALEQLP